MRIFKKFVLVNLFVLSLVFVFTSNIAKAAPGEGIATINGGVNTNVALSTSNIFTVILTVGTGTGIEATDDNPTFTPPANFTLPEPSGETSLGDVDIDGEWFAAGAGGTCAITMVSSSANGITGVITLDVTGDCVQNNTITLTYKATVPATVAPATDFVIKTSDSGFAGSIAQLTAGLPTITVTGTAVFANHVNGDVASTNNLVGLAEIGGTDIILGGFKITAAGEQIDMTSFNINVTLGTMVIGELTNLRLVSDTWGCDIDNDGIMQADELSGCVLSTIASPTSGSNSFGVEDIIEAGFSSNYFIVGTIASTVSDADTIDVEGTASGSTITGMTSLGEITPTGTSTNDTRTITDITVPTVAISLSDNNLTAGETMLVTFTFSKEPTGFDINDVTVSNGTLSAIDDSNLLIQTATFTPNTNITDSTNVISVGIDWTDSSIGLNPPAGITNSPNFSISTKVSSSSGSYYHASIFSNITPTTTPVIISEIQKIIKDLKFGMSNDKDIKTLQLFLINQDKGQSARALAKHGTTNNFFTLTKNALAEWQKVNNIVPAYGYFGKITRAKIKLLNL